MFVRLVVLCAMIGAICCQLTTPKRPLGYVYKGGSSDAQINLAIHMGPLCPKSRDALPTAKAVAEHYGAKKFRLTLHMFPLPYHQQAYLTAKAQQSVLRLASVDKAYAWLDKIYNEELKNLSNAATVNMTANQVVSLLAGYAVELGLDEGQFLSTMRSSPVDRATREAWEFSCTRAVASTPTYFLNDIIVAANPSWTLNDWKKAIDPSINGVKIVKQRVEGCLEYTVQCEYQPGKTVCCELLESCIPNVGCQCDSPECLIYRGSV